MNWAADSLHCVVFFPPNADRLDALQPWLRVFGDPPQSYQSAPPGMPPGGNAGAQIGDYQFTLAAQPGRLELVLGPSTASGPPAPISNLDEAITSLRGVRSQANIGAINCSGGASFKFI